MCEGCSIVLSYLWQSFPCGADLTENETSQHEECYQERSVFISTR